MELKTLWLSFLCFITSGVADFLWKRVPVAKSLIDGTNPYSYSTSFLRTEHVDMSKLACSTTCDNSNWCQTWCLDTDSGKCIKSNAVVSPLHVTNLINDTYQCYTHLEKDFIVGAIVLSAPPYNGFWTQVSSLLVRGVYNFVRQMTCAFVGVGANPWLMFDLKTPQLIHEIRITTQYYYFYYDLPHGAEIRVGLQPPLLAQNNSAFGNFSNLELFGTLPNPCAQLMTYSLKSQKGKLIRYISVEQNVAVSDRMSICQIMAL